MKIYASQNDLGLFETYAGKGVWIFCLDKRTQEDVWLQVLSITSGCPGLSQVSIISVDELDSVLSKGDDGYDEAIYCLSGIWTRDLSNFTIKDPIEIKSTRELYPNYPTDSDKFDRYIGKDIWVLAYSYTYGCPYYLKVLSRRDDFITANMIEQPAVEPEEIFHPSGRSLFRMLSKLEAKHLIIAGDWTIATPIETLSTDEIIDILSDVYDDD